MIKRSETSQDRSSKIGSRAQDSLALRGKQAPAGQIPLFGSAEPELPHRRVLVNPHLLAARRLARKMRQLPDHSVEETRAGLAICRQLKAYLQDTDQH